MATILWVSQEGNPGFSDAHDLAESGFAVVTASDGYHALRCIEARNVDALVVSSSLPDIAVDELARYLKLHQPGTPVVMLAPAPLSAKQRMREIDATIPRRRTGSQLVPTLKALLRLGKVRKISSASQVPISAPVASSL